MDKILLLEKQIIKAIIKFNSDHHLFEHLIKQIDGLTPLKREYTGVGFFTYYFLEEEPLDILKNSSFVLGGVYADLLNLKHGAQFILYVEDGLIKMLEGVSCGEKWPCNFKIKQLFQVQKDGSLKVIAEQGVCQGDGSR